LLRSLSSAFDLASQEAIINALYRQQFDIASVAPLVIETAAKGDRVSKRILDRACADLVDVICACVGKLEGESRRRVIRPLAFVGSLLTNENLYSRKVRAALRRKLPRVRVRPAESSPVVGAAIMAGKRI
jgi:N-acetylglucosamine kinase-like BadF-type ATPase